MPNDLETILSRLYSCCAAIAMVFTLLFVPETKDKRLDQITEGFAGKDKVKQEEEVTLKEDA